MIKQATQPELAFLGVLLAREWDGEGSMLDHDQVRWLASDILYGLAKPISAKKISGLPLDNVVEQKVLNEILCCFGKANWYGNQSISRMKLGGQL